MIGSLSSKIDSLLTIIQQNGLYLAPFGKEYTLASGGKSRILIDCSQAIRNHEAMQYIGSIYSAFSVGFGPIDAVGGPALGSEPIASAITYNTPGMRSFAVRKEPKGRGRDQGVITGQVQPGDRVCLVEDVITTGASLMRAYTACVDYGLKVQGLFGIVGRIPRNEFLKFCQEMSKKTGSEMIVLYTLEQVLGI